MRTTPTVTRAVQAFAAAARALGQARDAADVEEGEAWQVRAVGVEDAARDLGREVAALRLSDPDPDPTRYDRGDEHAAPDPMVRARACERVIHAAPWLVAALRVVNTARSPLPTADVYAAEALRLLGVETYEPTTAPWVVVLAQAARCLRCKTRLEVTSGPGVPEPALTDDHVRKFTKRHQHCQEAATGGDHG